METTSSAQAHEGGPKEQQTKGAHDDLGLPSVVNDAAFTGSGPSHTPTNDADAGIHTLPPEVLLDVFHTLRIMCSPGSLRWVQVSQVCKTWRNLVVLHESFWTRIDSMQTPRAWLQTLLERSGSSKLAVSIDPTWGESELSAILLHISRIEHLELYLKSAQEIDRALVWTEPARSLKWLTLLCPQRDAFIPTLPRVDCIPQLQGLALLSSCRVSLNWTFLHAITALRLGRQARQSLSNRELSRLLREIPGLQNLELLHSLERLHGDAMPLPIKLHSLSRLMIEDYPASCASFFHYFSIPRTCTVDIRSGRATHAPLVTEDFESVPKLLARNHGPYKEAAFGIRIGQQPTARRISALKLSPDTVANLEAPGRLALQYKDFSIPNDDNGMDYCTRTMWYSLIDASVSSLTELSVGLDSVACAATEIADWQNLFRRTVQLRTLHLSASQISQAVTAALETVAVTEGNPHGLVLPLLEFLDISMTPNTDDVHAETPSDAWPHIMRCLRARSAGREGVSILNDFLIQGELVACIEEEDMNWLENHIVDVWLH